MVFLDFFCLEMFIVIVTFYFILSNNIIVLLYNAGLFLFMVGMYSLLKDADIYIGFLWVIDLGVGLIFFIFMLHFVPFIHQKSKLNIKSRFLLVYNIFFFVSLLYLYVFSFNIDKFSYFDLNRMWYFSINYLDYYLILFTNDVTELNLLKECYFLLNGFEFFLINFSLFYGLVTSILLCFMIQRIFNFLNYSQISRLKMLGKLDSGFFIRNQNFVSQANAPIVTRNWYRKKSPRSNI